MSDSSYSSFYSSNDSSQLSNSSKELFADSGMFSKEHDSLSIMNKGARIALRAKVNESVITGLSIVDTILPIGRGQRQLVLGDRNTGKTSIFLNTLISCSKGNYLGTIEGFGSKRLYGIYVAINQNLSKLVKFIDYLQEFNIH
jgi:F-type H+-transporting ATPase subunit alpha